jgi:Flp pilus assembly protein TadG
MTTRRRREFGQSMVEFALVLPIFLMLVFGVMDLSRVVWANSTLAHASREAARFAIVQGVTDDSAKDAIRARALEQAIGGGDGLTVEVCYGLGCSGNADALGASYERGTPVSVTVRGSVSATTGALFGFGTIDVSGSTTMLVNR